jgi:hypothetical protein
VKARLGGQAIKHVGLAAIYIEPFPVKAANMFNVQTSWRDQPAVNPSADN